MTEQLNEKYEIVATLGRGSMGVVYKARDQEIGRLVAVKTLRSIFLGDDDKGNEALKRFKQESRSAGRLHHPNIVTIFETGKTQNGSPFIAMEYIEGRSLEQILQERSRLDPLEGLHYLAQVASAIDYAHSQNVIHRDIKPSNVLIDTNYRPHLLDFGVAKMSDTSLTPAGTVVGTPSYMSPEQIRGEQLDGSTDVFSLAVMAFELLTGVRPFPGKDFTTVVSNIIHKEPLTFAEVGCDLPRGLQDVLFRALSKDRKHRFTSALEFVDVMAQIFDVVLDGTGIIGGFRPGLTLDSVFKRSAGSPTNGHSAARDSETVAMSAPVKNSGWTLEQKTVPPEPKKEKREQAKESIRKENPRRETNAQGGGRGMQSFLVWLVIVLAAVVVVPTVLVREFWSHDVEVDSTPDEMEPVTVAKEDSALPSTAGTSTFSNNPSGETRDNTLEKESLSPETAEKVVATEKTSEPAESFDVKTILIEDISRLSNDNLCLMLSDPLFTEKSQVTLPSGLSVGSLFKAVTSEAGKREGRDITLALTQAAEHPDYMYRIEVLRALGTTSHLSSEAGFQAILSRLSDSEYLVRGFAAKILSSTNSKVALQALEKQSLLEENELVKKVLQGAIDRMKTNLAT